MDKFTGAGMGGETAKGELGGGGCVVRFRHFEVLFVKDGDACFGAPGMHAW